MAHKKGKGNTKHGMSGTRLYRTWKSMKLRCHSPNTERWEHYGGRGIKVGDEWQTFQPFYEWAMANGYDESLTLDRINVDGNYEPSNCRWADMETQALNRHQHKSNTGHLGITKRVTKTKSGEYVRYVARVKRHQVMHNVGSFPTLEEAIAAREKFLNEFEQIEKS